MRPSTASPAWCRQRCDTRERAALRHPDTVVWATRTTTFEMALRRAGARAIGVGVGISNRRRRSLLPAYACSAISRAPPPALDRFGFANSSAAAMAATYWGLLLFGHASTCSEESSQQSDRSDRKARGSPSARPSSGAFYTSVLLPLPPAADFAIELRRAAGQTHRRAAPPRPWTRPLRRSHRLRMGTRRPWRFSSRPRISAHAPSPTTAS